MKLSEKRQQKIEHTELIKVFKRARKQAEKFIRANSKIDPQLQIKYI